MYRGEPRRHGEALLCPAVGRVDAPVLQGQRDPRQRGDAIQYTQRARVPGGSGDALHRLQHTSGGLRVDEGHHARPHSLDGLGHGGVRKGCPPVGVHPGDPRPHAPGHFAHAPAEDPVAAHHNLVAR